MANVCHNIILVSVFFGLFFARIRVVQIQSLRLSEANIILLGKIPGNSEK